MLTKSDIGASEWVDPDDAPPLTEAFFDNAVYEVNGVRMPNPPKRGRPPAERPKIHTRLRMDSDVLDYFKASGKGWQTRINAALRAVMERGG